jgi:hypothetical protein
VLVAAEVVNARQVLLALAELVAGVMVALMPTGRLVQKTQVVVVAAQVPVGVRSAQAAQVVPA